MRLVLSCAAAAVLFSAFLLLPETPSMAFEEVEFNSAGIPPTPFRVK